MRLSDEKRLSLASKITDSLCSKGGPTSSSIRSKVFVQVRKVFDHDGRRETEIDAKVVRKISSIKRGIREGSAEWEALALKFRDEELSAIHIPKKW